MSWLTYSANGVTASLQMVRTDGIQRQVVYSEDGQDVLYQRWRFDVLAVLSRLDVQTLATGPTATRPTGALADKVLRNTLMTPRGQLVFTADDGTEVLRSPADGYACDATGGPKPRFFDVVSFRGSECVLVRWVVETDVTPCDNDPLILSHRWTMRESINEVFLPTRTVEGTVVFHLGELINQNVDPDRLRFLFPHPVPVNFQRQHVEVKASGDGTKLHYVIVDAMQPMNATNLSKIAKIQAHHTEQVVTPSLVDKAAALTSLKGLANEFMKAANEPLTFIKEMAPRYFSHVQVRVWGHRTATRRELSLWAISIAANQLQLNKQAKFLPSIDAALTHVLHEKFVEFKLTLQHPPSVFSLVRATTDLLGFFGPDDEVTTLSGLVALTAKDAVNPAPPLDNATRGPWLGTIVAQFLRADECQAPTAAVNYNQGFTDAATVTAFQNALLSPAPVVRGQSVVELPPQSQAQLVGTNLPVQGTPPTTSQGTGQPGAPQGS